MPWRVLGRDWPSTCSRCPITAAATRRQPWLLGLGARLAVVSVGVDNGYGHPSPQTLAPLEAAGLDVFRTDLDGDVAVIADDDDGLRVATRGEGNLP